MDEQQREAFEKAVEAKKEDAKRRSEQPAHPTGGPVPDAAGGDKAEIHADSHTQDEFSIRDKNSQKGKVTADKWNQ